MADNDFHVRGAFQGQGSPGNKTIRVGDDGSQINVSRYQELALRGYVFSFTVAAVTLPVNAGTLASKMGVYNPPNSGVFMEIIDVSAHAVVATTVVDALGLYYSNGSNATGSTFTTAGAAQNARVGEGRGAQCIPYSAVTHVGTPVLLDLVGGWGAVTDGGSTLAYKEFGQKRPILLPPSTLLAVAMTTAASTGSGITAAITWAEIPYYAM